MLIMDCFSFLTSCCNNANRPSYNVFGKNGGSLSLVSIVPIDYVLTVDYIINCRWFVIWLFSSCSIVVSDMLQTCTFIKEYLLSSERQFSLILIVFEFNPVNYQFVTCFIKSEGKSRLASQTQNHLNTTLPSLILGKILSYFLAEQNKLVFMDRSTLSLLFRDEFNRSITEAKATNPFHFSHYCLSFVNQKKMRIFSINFVIIISDRDKYRIE